MVCFLCELISNRCFTLQTSDGRLNHPRLLKKWHSAGFHSFILLFIIYISDLPHTQSQQYGYSDELALLYVDKDWRKIEKMLESDMMNISTYLDKQRLKLSTAKTTTTAFHLNNREAHSQLKILSCCHTRAIPHIWKLNLIGNSLISNTWKAYNPKFLPEIA